MKYLSMFNTDYLINLCVLNMNLFREIPRVLLALLFLYCSCPQSRLWSGL